MTRIRGIDFTSTPDRRKPITLAEGQLEGEVLRIDELWCLTSFDEFEAALQEPGPWVAGIDFPFGQPRKFLDNVNWPTDSWTGYVDLVAQMRKEEFEQGLRKYKADRCPGDKDHKRRTDVLAKSASPMNIVNPPVGKMFFQGAPRILRSGASIVPCAPNDSERVIVEGYPARVVQELTGSRPRYKDEVGREQVRKGIVDQLVGRACRDRYGLVVRVEGFTAEQVIGDRKGDLLDAVLCAVQAAWASRHPRHGIPADCDPLEGWIVDPSLVPLATNH